MKIPVEQFIATPTTGQAARAEAGARNGFRVPEKVRIPTCQAALRALIGPLATLTGYAIPCLFSFSPTVGTKIAARVSIYVPLDPAMTGVWWVFGCFLIEGGRGSEFVGATGFLYWISRPEKFSHWTGGVHGYGC